MSDRPWVSVVICTMAERTADLKRCLGSLIRLRTTTRYEVLVVGQKGEDLTWVEEEFGPPFPIRVLFADGRGAAEKKNLGVAASRSEVIAFLDDDARVRPDYIEQLRVAFTDDVAAVAGAIEPDFDVEPQGELRDVAFHIGGFNRWNGTEDRTRWASANCAFRRSLLASDAPFDVGLGTGSGRIPWGEETKVLNWFDRHHGVLFASAVTVDHRIQRERVTVTYVLERAFECGRARYWLDVADGRLKLIHRLYMPLISAWASLKCVTGGQRLRDKIRREQFRGYVRELRRR